MRAAPVSAPIDIAGQRFGLLVAIDRRGRTRGGQTIWRFRCDCGSTVEKQGAAVRSGHTTSCGCARLENNRTMHLTHSATATRLYRIWGAMKKRCSTPSAGNYERYGGRGIRVCDEWGHSFERFREWALRNGYADDLSIDRIDNDDGYSPGNCRWATAVEQRHNRRDAVAA